MGRKQSPILNNNKLKLGFFSPNCSGGMSVTKVPERWVNSWDNNIRLAQLADEAGIEFLLPIARWIGYGGETDFHGSVLETLTWATGLLASSEIEGLEGSGSDASSARGTSVGLASGNPLCLRRRLGFSES